METVTISKELLQELISNYYCASGTASDIYDRCNGYEKDGLDDDMEELEEMDSWVEKNFDKYR